MSTERVAAIILLVGSVLFIIAAFMPVSRVFAEPTPAAKLQITTATVQPGAHRKYSLAWAPASLPLAWASLPTICAPRREPFGPTSAS